MIAVFNFRSAMIGEEKRVYNSTPGIILYNFFVWRHQVTLEFVKQVVEDW